MAGLGFWLAPPGGFRAFAVRGSGCKFRKPFILSVICICQFHASFYVNKTHGLQALMESLIQVYLPAGKNVYVKPAVLRSKLPPSDVMAFTI